MKYHILTQIQTYLQKYKKITNIKRVGDTLILAEFDGSNRLFFDLNKSNSNIHKNENFIITKDYKAPFDVILQKRFNSSSIDKIEVLENNRVLKIQVSHSGSYKKLVSAIYFEFTGRFTNIIIVDENGVILEALRHYENEQRVVKVGKTLELLKPFEIKEKQSDKIGNFDEFFKAEFDKQNLEKLQTVRTSKLNLIDKKLENLHKNLNSLDSKDELLQKSEELNQKGMILTANLHNLDEFKREFELLDFNENRVKFNLKDNPKTAAKELFNESKKLKQKALGINLESANLLQKIEFFSNLKQMIEQSNSSEELNILLPKTSAKKELNKEFDNIENFYIKEFKISVGKNEKGNISLLKDAKKNDFWFHLKDLPSAHVIVKTNKQSLSEDIINFAAKLCVNMSVKASGNYLVDYTKKENVKVVDGAFVNYVKYATISVLKP
ncbi:NFACT RNA binding domain-containing protein [Campylobacter geochelonis]|uniref:Putative fibronectin/fibrinogen-binding protein n=1 Tax=Campylobacter geochelonis TaxID=1780362 RepID=A0A128EBS4_9BACT|nr:NFACT RNA binding domain-containing protein [Campylobacter geochelonis]QKF72112.1 putative ribosome quality control (RQC) complex component, YloA/Tae2 family [Campylobacter geochelonis]CZE45921.1 putative fibronectin/fibrinogen-binding protein [Campylobacter geochelonis]CZE46710.1 putative fibronectin/fibrinogen-binding protein [Campylobacter geochelonis]CZE49802.1 putative fibronectin/fibrinogen-binding protein [Campylobacter geochelonis]